MLKVELREFRQEGKMLFSCIRGNVEFCPTKGTNLVSSREDKS